MSVTTDIPKEFIGQYWEQTDISNERKVRFEIKGNGKFVDKDYPKKNLVWRVVVENKTRAHDKYELLWSDYDRKKHVNPSKPKMLTIIVEDENSEVRLRDHKGYILYGIENDCQITHAIIFVDLLYAKWLNIKK